eukprot:GHVR01065660.1.p1 GENE.GHVR01065660.1~~GHVR01065660.1.p1  ORF type:complete len:565 (-),score=67.60 GHVR01065660.1:550-2244(-)
MDTNDLAYLIGLCNWCETSCRVNGMGMGSDGMLALQDGDRNTFKTNVLNVTTWLFYASCKNGRGASANAAFFAGLHDIISLSGNSAEGGFARDTWNKTWYAKPQGLLVQKARGFELTLPPIEINASGFVTDFNQCAMILVILHGSLHAVCDKGSIDLAGRKHMSLVVMPKMASKEAPPIQGEVDRVEDNAAATAAVANAAVSLSKGFVETMVHLNKLMTLTTSQQDLTELTSMIKSALLLAATGRHAHSRLSSAFLYWIEPSPVLGYFREFLQHDVFTIFSHCGTEIPLFGSGASAVIKEGKTSLVFMYDGLRNLGFYYLRSEDYDSIIGAEHVKISNTVTYSDRDFKEACVYVNAVEGATINEHSLGELFVRRADCPMPHPEEFAPGECISMSLYWQNAAEFETVRAEKRWRCGSITPNDVESKVTVFCSPLRPSKYKATQAVPRLRGSTRADWELAVATSSDAGGTDKFLSAEQRGNTDHPARYVAIEHIEDSHFDASAPTLDPVIIHAVGVKPGMMFVNKGKPYPGSRDKDPNKPKSPFDKEEYDHAGLVGEHKSKKREHN